LAPGDGPVLYLPSHCETKRVERAQLLSSKPANDQCFKAKYITSKAAMANRTVKTVISGQ
jgi:hypothetical protein